MDIDFRHEGEFMNNLNDDDSDGNPDLFKFRGNTSFPDLLPAKWARCAEQMLKTVDPIV